MGSIVLENLDGHIEAMVLKDRLMGFFLSASEETQQGFKKDWNIGAIQKLYESGTSKLCPIVFDGVDVGYVWMHRCPDMLDSQRISMRIVSIYLLPEVRKDRVFAKVLALVKKEAKQQGCTDIVMSFRYGDKFVGKPECIYTKLEI